MFYLIFVLNQKFSLCFNSIQFYLNDLLYSLYNNTFYLIFQNDKIEKTFIEIVNDNFKQVSMRSDWIDLKLLFYQNSKNKSISVKVSNIVVVDKAL